MGLERLSVDTIKKCLATREIGRNIVFRHSVSSTMDVAVEEVRRGAAHGTVIIAETQEQGKGRLDRSWISPAGGVYLSIILYPPQALLPALTMTASLAVIDSIQDVCGIRAGIKWPNDVLIGGKKIGGILAQSGNSESSGCYAVIGIGINANMDLSIQPEIADSATSLSVATGKPIQLQAVICGLLNNFEKRYLDLQSGQNLWVDWEKLLVTLGKFVSVRSGRTLYEGLAEAVNSEGSLLLRRANGEVVVVPAGDVSLRT